jgi:hypothetical protein
MNPRGIIENKYDTNNQAAYSTGENAEILIIPDLQNV